MVKEEDTVVNKRIAERLKMIRHIRGFSLKDIGEKLNMTYQQVQKYEAGKNNIPLCKLLILSEIFNVKMDIFFAEKAMCDLESYK
jgi:transcriptional regulator with XRE-family HTH domain